MTAANSSIFVSAGEISGDHYIAKVCRLLREKGCDSRIYGLCGEESRDSGVECLWRNERLHLIGVAEVISSLPDILRLKNEIYRNIIKERPHALLLADSPDFHLPLVRELRRGGYKGRIFYISPPSVWAWRSYRVRDLACHIDECLPLFKFEHDYLRMARCASLWMGHPLVEEFRDFTPHKERIAADIRGPVPKSEDREIIALLPGSRRSEIEQLAPILAEVYDELDREGYMPVFSVAQGLSERAKSSLLSIAGDKRRYYEGSGRDIMGVSSLVIGSSGTATAEALLLGRYMVVLYKVHPLSALIGRTLLGHLRFAIPNLLARDMFYPELIQERATAKLALNEAFSWLRSGKAARAAKEKRMKELVSLMGRPGVYDFWAERILTADNRDNSSLTIQK